VSSAEQAKRANQRFVEKVERRSEQEDAVSKFCIESYRARLADGGDEHPLHDLTRHLVDTVDTTADSIRRRMTRRWEGHPNANARIESSVTNSLRRSAGTNYQALVAYSLARHLLESQSYWYVVHPVPKPFAYNLSIEFTGGLSAFNHSSDDAQETRSAGEADPAAGENGPEVEVDPEAAEDVSVKPDLDILIRNASWRSSVSALEPVLLLSVKTSLADRAGAAARWKTYFDLVTRPCPHHADETCAYRRLGIQLLNPPSVDIAHAIVTANIYKINSDQAFARYGELRSNQARANTFMFDLRFTTREESSDVMAPGWESLVNLPGWLKNTSTAFGLPH
jgi:hypothetical protein